MSSSAPEVEVVGRLVEQEEVRLHDEQAGKARAHNPAAAHLAGLAVELRFAEAEAAQHLPGLGLDLCVVQRVVLGVRFEILGAGDIAGLFEFVQALLQTRQLVHAAGGDIENGFVTVRLGLLRQVAHHGPFVARDDAGVGLLLLENDGEEGGLARAVRPDKRDTVAVVHAEGGVFEEHASAQGHLQITNRKHELSVPWRTICAAREGNGTALHGSRSGNGRRRRRREAKGETPGVNGRIGRSESEARRSKRGACAADGQRLALRSAACLRRFSVRRRPGRHSQAR